MSSLRSWWKILIVSANLLGAGSLLAAVLLFQGQANTREQVVRIVCVGQNAERGALRGLIVAGATGTKPFEGLFEKYGAPPYEERVRKAHEDAGTLYAIDCDRLAKLARDGTGLKRPPALRRKR